MGSSIAEVVINATNRDIYIDRAVDLLIQQQIPFCERDSHDFNTARNLVRATFREYFTLYCYSLQVYKQLPDNVRPLVDPQPLAEEASRLLRETFPHYRDIHIIK